MHVHEWQEEMFVGRNESEKRPGAK